jgi:hypothetical protein
MIDHDPATVEKVVTWGFLAGFGGAVKYVSTVIRGSQTVSKRRFIFLLAANTFISSFCGLMGGLLAATATTERLWTYISAGIFGYIGTQALDMVLFAVKRKIEPNAHVSSIFPVPSDNDNQ